jgi:adenylyltransferase/sulfurtransferase
MADTSALESEARALSAAHEREGASSNAAPAEVTCGLAAADYERYGRQLIMPAFGPAAQSALQSLSVLIVGAGGLGCPVAMYLAAAGVKHLTIVDHDTVDVSNLHRQIGHAEARRSMPKAESLALTCRGINSGVRVEAVVARFGASNGQRLVYANDIVVDASDNPATRYMVNDAAILAGKPLVSAAAVSTDGQLSVYGWRGGPCYRCVVPEPPPPAAVATCSDVGVLGPIVGIMGSLQALEVMKIAAALAREKAAAMSATAATAEAPALAQAHTPTLGEALASKMLLVDGSDGKFRLVSLRGRSPDCAVCSASRTIASLDDCAAWCAARGLVASDAPLAPEPSQQANCACAVENARKSAAARLIAADGAVPSASVRDLAAARSGHGATRPLVIDVRAPVQFAIASLRDSHCIPLSVLQHRREAAIARISQLCKERNVHAAAAAPDASGAAETPVYVLCRRGVDSLVATQLLNEAGIKAVNVAGGLQEWSRSVDRSFPRY